MITCVATGIFATAAETKGGSKTGIVGAARSVPGDRLVGICRCWLLGFFLLSGHAGVFAVPKGPRIAKAVSDSDCPVPQSLDGFEHVLCEVVDRLFMSIMGDDKPRLGERIALEYLVIENILGSLDQVGAVILVIVRIDIIENDVIAKFTELLSTFRIRGAAGVRWPHVAREVTKNISYGGFVLLHLLTALRGGDLAEILVRPSVTGNLVTTRMHALD